MSPVARKEPKKAARRIKHRRDFEAASAIAKKMSAADRDSAAEKRLQSLLHELDQFDGDETDGEELSDDLEDGLRRRWSDDGDA
jgi:hypothetical protein